MHILPPVPAAIRASPATTAPAPVSPVEATHRPGPVGPELPSAGARLIATIVGRLSADRYLASVAGSPWVLRMRSQHAPGDRLTLRVLAGGRGATWLQEARLEPSTGASWTFTTTSASTPAPLPSVSTSSALPGTGAGAQAGAAIPRLTDVAVALGTGGLALQDASAAPASRLATPVLLPDPAHETDGDTARAAASLRRSIAESALFHEARLARWVEGKLPFEELARIAQGANPPDGAALRAPQVALLLRGELGWEGCAWPGQDYSLVVDDDGGTLECADRSCRARLNLRLPTLGELELTVVLRAGRVAVCAQTQSDTSANRLAAAAAVLAGRLRSGGMQLAGLHFRARP
jgi:hypothetical protein